MKADFHEFFKAEHSIMGAESFKKPIQNRRKYVYTIPERVNF